MDHDLMGKQVENLLSFKKRAEEAIAFYEGIRAAGGLPTAPAGVGLSDDQIEKLKGDLTEFFRPLTGRLDAFENFRDNAVGTLDALQDFRVDVSAKLEGMPERLSALEVSKAEAESFSDRLHSMLTFFEENRESLEILLSLDGEPDAPDAPEAPPATDQPQTDPQPADPVVQAAAPADEPGAN